MKKIIIFGSEGQLGSQLVRTFKGYKIYAFSKRELDITKKRLIDKEIKTIKPDFVINAAAYTNVDNCEDHYSEAYNTNALAVKNIAESCLVNKAVVIHISTDYVFSGTKKGYKENDIPNPINKYGLSKLRGEEYLIAKEYYIIRTSGLYGENSIENFPAKIIDLAKRKDMLEVVDDQLVSPTYAKDLAEAIKHLVENHKKFKYGIYHLTNEGFCTWFDFAREIVKFKKLNVKIRRITSDKLQRKAARPKGVILLNTKFPKLRHWKKALKEYLNQNN